MSRIAKKPIHVPENVEISIKDRLVTVKGPKGALDFECHELVKVDVGDDSQLKLSQNETINLHKYRAKKNLVKAIPGTTCAILRNMITGVTQGFERKLTLIGVGYRAQLKGSVLNLTLGLSHPVNYEIPKGITIETPSQTEIIIKGIDKQLVGQAAAHIRAYRPPEPYKGKGVRYADENVKRKETKKK